MTDARPPFDPEREDRDTRLMRMLSSHPEGVKIIREWLASDRKAAGFYFWLGERLDPDEPPYGYTVRGTPITEEFVERKVAEAEEGFERKVPPGEGIVERYAAWKAAQDG